MAKTPKKISLLRGKQHVRATLQHLRVPALSEWSVQNAGAQRAARLRVLDPEAVRALEIKYCSA